MSKLVKKLENETDFIICIFLMKSGKYVVTIYDSVGRTHEKQGTYNNYEDALAAAKRINGQYQIKENCIRISESQIRKMVSECVKKILKESIGDGIIPYFYISLMKNGEPYTEEYRNKTKEEIKQEILQKHPKFSESLIEKWFNTPERYIDPNPPKKTAVPKAPKQKIGKPEGMSVEEYYRTMVLPNNKKMAEKANENPDEEFRPVKNVGRYFGGNVDYGCDYSVSKDGRLRVINLQDRTKGNIYDGYPAPTRNAMQFHLNGFADDGTPMKTCPDVKYIVADAWLEPHDYKKFMVIHKDGNWKNNKAENLMWVPKTRQTNK